MTIFGLNIDEFVKLASMLGGVLVAAAAVFAYYEKGTREQKKPFREAQLDLCRDASEAAATLASLAPNSSNTTGEDAWHVARARFEQLYWGSLAVVEDVKLEKAMVDFRKRLVECESELRAGTLDEETRWQLQQDALKIAHASRALIAEGWRLELPELTRKTKTAEQQQTEDAKLKARG